MNVVGCWIKLALFFLFLITCIPLDNVEELIFKPKGYTSNSITIV
jgi:hypothetical protein